MAQSIYRRFAMTQQKCVSCKRMFRFEKYWLIYHGGYFYTSVCSKCAKDKKEAAKKGVLVCKRPPAPVRHITRQETELSKMSNNLENI